jgi:transcriptional regulator with PAS, ATPase and Fis domain
MAEHNQQRTHVLAKLIGDAPSFARVRDQLIRLSESDATVLISGETGTGKELMARAVHYLSSKAGFPFVAVNCAALPDALLEAELFGHERGAFTDAHASRQGLLAQAGNGTLFLDEVECLTPRRMSISEISCGAALFAPICSTGCGCCGWICRRCGIGATTSRS